MRWWAMALVTAATFLFMTTSVYALFEYGEKPAPVTQTTQCEDGNDKKMYCADVVLFMPLLDDESKLMRIFDPYTRVFCYYIQNDTGEMMTGLQCIPINNISIHAPARRGQ